MAYARQAIEADPSFAIAYAAVASFYSLLGLLGLLPPAEAFPKAKAAVLKALEIDDSVAEAHMVLATVRLSYDWDWFGAEQACKRAIELNPNFAWGHAIWSDWLSIMGRLEEAVAESRIATELDPLSASLNFKFGQKLYWIGEYDHAIEAITKALELDPSFRFNHAILAHVYARKGMHEESLVECDKEESVCGPTSYGRVLLALILAMAGRTDEAKKNINEWYEQPKLDPMSLITLAEAYSVMGEKTEAFAILESAYKERMGLMIFFVVYPNFNNIRSDPRYADLLRRMGLPQLRSQTSPS